MPELAPTKGTLAHLLLYLRQLPTAGDTAFLVVTVPKFADAFVQVTWSLDGFGVDHPLVSPAQLAREPAIRDACAQVGHVVVEVPLDEGDRALDCYLPNDATLAGVVIAAILRSAMGVTDTTVLEYSGNDIAAVAG